MLEISLIIPAPCRSPHPMIGLAALAERGVAETTGVAELALVAITAGHPAAKGSPVGGEGCGAAGHAGGRSSLSSGWGVSEEG